MIDDEPTLLGSLSTYLRRAGHHVDVASNGVEAITALNARAFDVVVTDINMPESHSPGSSWGTRSRRLS